MPPQRGVILRHLVMPGQTQEATEIMKFIAGEVSKDTYVNVMEQYRVVHQDYTDQRYRLHPEMRFPSLRTMLEYKVYCIVVPSLG